jgi:hypothetical protein
VRYALAQEEEVEKLIAAFRTAQPGGAVVADLEKLLRTAIFKPAAQLVGQLLQEASDKIDAACQVLCEGNPQAEVSAYKRNGTSPPSPHPHLLRLW